MTPDYRNRKSKQTLRVAGADVLAEGVYSLTLEYPAETSPREVRPGQFVGVFTPDPSALLMRPISICEWDEKTGRIRLVYRTVGKGTRAFARLRAGDAAEVLGMLGNGYDVPALTGKRVLLLGGGIGAPPMLGLAGALHRANAEERSAAGEERRMPEPAAAAGPGAGAGPDAAAEGGFVTSVMGYRTNDLFLTKEFAAAGRLVIATDDGTAGFCGNAVEAAKDLVSRKGAVFDVICACGPLPMLRAVKALAQELGIPAYISLEERMACGVGACLGCVVKTKAVDGHSHVRNARVCTEGPVFFAEDVEL